MVDFLKRFFRGFSFLTLCALLVPATVFVCVLGAFIFLPLPATLPTPKDSLPSQATKIYDINGEEIATMRTFEQNVPFAKEEIPEVFKKALLASEDRNFYNHVGVDVRGSLRALWSDVRNQDGLQGGSTITQQYVKNAYLTRDRTITRKVREAIIASQVDRQVPKDEIMYRYLDNTYFGNGAYGLGAAAQSYFRKQVKDLTLSESASLVGMIPAPSAWDPRGHPADNELRRKSVLGQMKQLGWISEDEYNDAISKPVWVLESQGQPTGEVTKVHGFEEVATRYPYFVDYVRKYLTIKYGEQAVLGGGMRVQTTLDPKLQDEAEKSVARTLSGTRDPLSLSLVSVEPPTGFVRAMVGGRDWQQSQLNLALGGCPSNPFPDARLNLQVQSKPSCWTTPVAGSGGTGRQPGSAFKPYVLAAAYEKGVQPTKTYRASKTYSAPGCRVAACVIGNNEGEVFGTTTIKEAMAHSVNTVFAPLSLDVGNVEISEMAKKLGVTSVLYSKDFHQANGNYSLGVIDASPLDMAASYGVFANGGLRQDVTPVVKIVDTSGAVIEDNSTRKGQQVIDKAVADNVTDALKGVIDHGTAANAKLGRPAAGKTGTTNDFVDAWFVGYTPTLSTAVWMGNRDGNRSINYKGTTRVYGGGPPAQTWAAFMKAALEDVPPTDFSEPAPIKKPVSDVLTPAGPKLITTFSPKTVRTPIQTPTGDYSRDQAGTPSVSPPARSSGGSSSNEDDSTSSASSTRDASVATTSTAPSRSTSTTRPSSR